VPPVPNRRRRQKNSQVVRGKQSTVGIIRGTGEFINLNWKSEGLMDNESDDGDEKDDELVCVE